MQETLSPEEKPARKKAKRRIVDAKSKDEQVKKPSRRKPHSRPIRMRANIDSAEELRKLEYVEYLKTEYWQHCRHFALQRADNRCQVCYSNTQLLHVHHRTYKRLGREQDNDLTVLCEECHELFHKHGKLAKDR